MIKRLLVSIEISRPHNMLITAFGVAAGYLIAGGHSAAAVWPTALFTALVTGAGNIINDYHDVHIDKINKPRRPLPSGRIPIRAAATIYVLTTALITVGAVVFLPPRIAALMIVWQLGLYIYARWAKRKFVVGNLLVATITSSVFLAGALLTRNVAAAVIPVSIAIVFVFSRELVKGAEDLEGDRASGVSTVAVVAGLDRTALLASVMLLLLASAIPWPALAGHYGRPYLWVMELAVVPGLLVASYTILKNPDRKTFGRVSWLLKIEMFFGILAMGLGKL